jgi:hypothetical protein
MKPIPPTGRTRAWCVFDGKSPAVSPASKNLTEGTATFLVGLALKLFTGGVEIPVLTLTKVGVVLMAVGGCLVLLGLVQAGRTAGSRH